MGDKMKTQRLTNLDIIKMLACLSIIFHHFQQNTGLTLPYINFYGGSFDWSSTVELFFMISGFLAVRTDKAGEKGIFKAFVKKYLRFLVTVIPAGLLAAAAAYAVYFKTGGWLSGISYTPWKVIKGLLLIDRGWFGTDGLTLNNPTWFLSILLFCFALFYAIKLFCARFDPLKAEYFYAAAVAVYFLLFRFAGFFYLPFFNPEMYRGAIPFFVGCLLCKIYTLPDKKLWILRGISLVPAAALFKYYGMGSIFLVFWLYPLIIDISVHSKQAGGAAVRALGEISPAAYIWHVPFLQVIITLVALCGLYFPVNVRSMLGFAAFVCLFAWLWHRLVEAPVYAKLKNI